MPPASYGQVPQGFLGGPLGADGVAMGYSGAPLPVPMMPQVSNARSRCFHHLRCSCRSRLYLLT